MGITRRKEDKKKDNELDRDNCLEMLQQVSLGGTIEECILTTEKGKGFIEAVDITSSLIVISKSRLLSHKSEDMTLGLGNIEILTKFISSMKEKIFIETDEGKIVLKRGDNRRKLNYLLTDPDLIATKIESKGDVYSKISKLMEFETPLSEKFIKDYLSYITILKSKETTIILDGEKLTFICGEENNYQFELELNDAISNEDEEDFRIKINGEHLSKILNIIEYDETDPPLLRFANDAPIMIEEDTTSWILNPMTDMEDND